MTRDGRWTVYLGATGWTVLDENGLAVIQTRSDNAASEAQEVVDVRNALVRDADLHDGLVAVARRLLDGWTLERDVDGTPLGWYLESGIDDVGIDGDADIEPHERRALDHLATQPTEDTT